MICHSNQTRQDAAEKAIRGKQADRIHELEEVVEELGVGLAGQTERAEELQSDLKLCEKDRELNFNTALRLYQDPGSLVRIERRNFIDQIEQLKSNVLICEQDIWSRNQLIEALRYDIALYANQEHWILLRQHYFALQQQYGQMPRDFQRLERKYEDLEDEHINLSDRFKRLEGDHTELKVQHDQIKDERHQLEDDAETSKRSAQEAEARYWALEVQCDHIREQKAKSEKEAGAKERFLADLAARMFKQTMSMARILVGIDIDPMDDEQVALCQLAQKYLGLNANEITNKLAKPESSEDGEVEDERDESNLQATHSENASSSTFVSESNNLESTFPIAEANASSIAAATDGENVPESPAAFATFKAVLQKPFEKGSIISQDLIKSPEDTNEEANDSASVLQDVFNPPRFQDFNFGGSSSAVHFIGNETKPSALPELISEPKPFSIFNISNTSSVQASQSAIDPPRFGQDFAFGSSNGNVSFTANQQTSSNPPASGSEVQSPNASSLPGTSETQDTSSASKIAQAKETTTEEQFPNKDPTENENTKKHAPEIYTPSKTTPKGDNPNKKAQKKKSQKEEEPRKEKPKFDGLNRNQRRAASRERKSAEKKAQAQAETTRHRGRSEVARAMMRGWMR